MKKRLVLLIIFEVILVGIIGLLGYKIWQRTKGQIKGTYVTRIKQDEIAFSSESGRLKYFYEPKQSQVETDRPDWLGYEVKYTINSDSLNERFEYTIPKPRNTYRIITIGDSFTFGQYVNTAENFSELLEDSLNQLQCNNINHFEVINLGMKGYDVEYTVERFIKRGIKYQPDLVIWIINGHNFRKINELTIPIINELRNNGAQDFDSNTGLYFITEKALEIMKNKFGEDFITSYQNKAIKKLQDYYKDKLLFLTFKAESIPYIKVLRDFIRDNPNSIYHEIYNVWTNDTYHLLDFHPNKKGHERIVSDIFSFLRESNLYNCDTYNMHNVKN